MFILQKIHNPTKENMFLIHETLLDFNKRNSLRIAFPCINTSQHTNFTKSMIRIQKTANLNSEDSKV